MEIHKITPASYLILEKNQKILLLKRFNTGFKDGQYSLISGHIEKNESATNCIIREAKEEVGIQIKKEDLKLSLVLHRKSDQNSEERVDFFFKAKKWKGEIINKEPNKCSELNWFNKNKLPKKTINYIKKVLNEINKKSHYLETGWSK
jgi:8-oxo-dGTP diphosphatase